MIKVEVNMPAIAHVQAFWRKYPEALQAALYDGLIAIALEIQRTAVERLKGQGAIDLGQLWNSIHIHRISPTEIVVGTNVEYAAAVEFGAEGHWLTIDKIPGFRGWMKRHGINLDGRMKYFYVHPKPRPYMEPAYQEGKRIAPDEVKRAVEEAMAGVGL